MAQRTYIAIDLKSFYASVECVERGLDPLTTNLVVADLSRTEKTICLAVSPSLKARGISGRPRLFEVEQRLKTVNYARRREAPGGRFSGKSVFEGELRSRPDLEIDYIAAVPRMALYIDYSARIYDIYLKYIAPEDIHVYSIDEVFMDVTAYLDTYKTTAHSLAMTIIRDVLGQTGITATAGIGSNLYLSKVAMDIVAKHIPPDKDGVRIAELDEMSYRRLLWNHRPITDFWRVGRGIAARLEVYGVKTMGQLARLSMVNEEALYKLFGVNAELLIDHAWGWEPVTMDYIKSYAPESNSLGNGQVLKEGYEARKARIVTLEMADSLALDLVEKGLVANQVVLTVSYDPSSLGRQDVMKKYSGKISTDWYGRQVPAHAHGSVNLPRLTSSSRLITRAVGELFDRIVNPDLLVRRLGVTMNHVVPRVNSLKKEVLQLDLFSDPDEFLKKEKEEAESLAKEHALQKTLIGIKKKYGKNAILKGLDFEDGATARERNEQIGGHKA